MILIIDNYDSFTYNIVQYLYELGFDSKVFRNDEITLAEIEKLNPTHIIISPGPKTPSEAGITKEVIKHFAGKIPLLGICLGHQAIGEVFGGKVVNAKELVHGKTSMIYHDGKTIFAGLDSPFEAGRYHSLAVKAKDLPECLEISAYTRDNEIMGLRHKTLKVEGVQFHPESILTKQGKKILKNFIEGSVEQYLFKDILNNVVNKKDLTNSEAIAAMNMIMSGELTDAQISSFLTAMRMKGETIDELVGFANVMRAKAERVDLGKYDVVDTCGTGGDGRNTFNISTVASIVAASCGAMIAKHGNRGVSSKSGSADLLKALGIKIDLSKEKVRESIIEHGMGFMFAPNYHKSMKYVVNSRREMGIRTFFNILGPLANPAGAKYQVLGVFDQALTEKLAKVLGELGSKRVFVVSSNDGMDEISLSDKTKVSEYSGGEVKTFYLDPRDYGFKFCKLLDLQIIDVDDSVRVALDVFKGEKGARRDIVVLNAALVLEVTGIAKNFKDGIKLAEDAIDSGKAIKKLEELKLITN